MPFIRNATEGVPYSRVPRSCKTTLMELLPAERANADPHGQQRGQRADAETGERADDQPGADGDVPGRNSPLNGNAGSICRAR